MQFLFLRNHKLYFIQHFLLHSSGSTPDIFYHEQSDYKMGRQSYSTGTAPINGHPNNNSFTEKNARQDQRRNKTIAFNRGKHTYMTSDRRSSYIIRAGVF